MMLSFSYTTPYKLIPLQDYIVLSGGLGSSAYVRSALKDEFRGYRGRQVLVSEDP